MKSSMTSRWIWGNEDTSACFSIRRKVFIEEQGFQNEFDETDAHAWHLLICLDGIPAATARVFHQESTYWVGRIAVLPLYRKLGLGRHLLCLAEEKARCLGASALYLDAQTRARPFYEKRREVKMHIFRCSMLEICDYIAKNH